MAQCDYAAFLTTPAAIRFQAEHHWDAVRAACHALAREARDRIKALTGLPLLCPDSPEWFGQLPTVCLPEAVDCACRRSQGNRLLPPKTF